MMIYVSTLAFTGKSPEEIELIAKENNFALEFSSGLPYRSDMEQFFKDVSTIKILHNYFPAPQNPFVLNLASRNSDILSRSIEHCLTGINITANNDCAFYAAHAGFCIDPRPDDLGGKLNKKDKFDLDTNWNVFINSLEIILNHAKSKGVKFLIENNVLAPFNYIDFKNPLLCCESKDIIKVFEHFKYSDYFGLLLDTAHLKVSCQTLKLDITKELEKISNYIKAIHHSDNNGEIDSNLPINNDYWFLPHLKNYAALPQVLEVKKSSISSIISQLQLLELYGN
jgi:sugar phosphate isomerase/epimerase